MIYLWAAVALLGGAVAVMRRYGVGLGAPRQLFTIYLLLYLPVRGLAVHGLLQSASEFPLSPSLVQMRDTDFLRQADVMTLLICGGWIAGLVVVGALRHLRPTVQTGDGTDGMVSGPYRPTAGVPLLSFLFLLFLLDAITTPGASTVVVHAPGPVTQVAAAGGIAYFACLSLVVAEHRAPRLLLAATMLVAVVIASKALLLQLAFAITVGVGFRTAFQRRPRRQYGTASVRRLSLLVLAVAAVLVFALPVLEASHVSQTPISSNIGAALDHSPAQDLSNSLLYITDRLHGYDSLAVSVPHAASDPVFDPLRGASALPLALFSSANRLLGVDAPYLSLRFSEMYWGSSRRSLGYIAPSFFGQMTLAGGEPWAVAVAIGLGCVMASGERALVRSKSGLSRVILFVVVSMPFYVERDIGSTFISFTRACMFLILIWLVLARAHRSAAGVRTSASGRSASRSSQS